VGSDDDARTMGYELAIRVVGSISWATDRDGTEPWQGETTTGDSGRPGTELTGAFTRLRQAGHAVRLVGAEEAIRFESALHRAALGHGPLLVAEDEGYVDLPRLVATRLEAVTAAGGALVRSAAPARLGLQASQAVVSTAEVGPIRAGQIVVARPAQTPSLLQAIGIQIGDATTTGVVLFTTDGGGGLRRIVRAPGFNIRPQAPGVLLVHATAIDRATGD
jgi:hypothetical protein